MDQPAPMTSTTVPQPPVSMEALVLMVMVLYYHVFVHLALVEQVVLTLVRVVFVVKLNWNCHSSKTVVVAIK